MQNDDFASGEKRSEPWWLSPGFEWCFVCEASVHAEALGYCIACDRPLCPLCMMFTGEGGAIQCPDCDRDCDRERRED